MMYALSIRQPWAWLILFGGKDVENRTWRTNIRGEILIHAASGMTRREYDDACRFVERFDYKLANRIPLPSDKHGLPRGGFVGTARITGTIECRPGYLSVTGDGAAHIRSPWLQGPVGFVLSDPSPLVDHFVPATGFQRFFKPRNYPQ